MPKKNQAAAPASPASPAANTRSGGRTTTPESPLSPRKRVVGQTRRGVKRKKVVSRVTVGKKQQTSGRQVGKHGSARRLQDDDDEDDDDDYDEEENEDHYDSDDDDDSEGILRDETVSSEDEEENYGSNRGRLKDDAPDDVSRGAQESAAIPRRQDDRDNHAPNEFNRGTHASAAIPRGNNHHYDVGTEQAGRMVGVAELPVPQKNITRRVVAFVKDNVFRRIKFLTSESQLKEAFRMVLDEEKPKSEYLFTMMYQDCFKKALNQKRSTCEQAGKLIVVRAINQVFKNRGEDFFTFEELCKLRRATTEREKKAFFWFFDNFIDCVVGANNWNVVKTKQLVSDAVDNNNSKVVSVSDEAFALLLIDNYMEKWRKKASEEEETATEMTSNQTTNHEGTRKAVAKMPGKYTGKAKGQCKWGGWNVEGITQFNRLRRLVKEDRAADKDRGEPRKMERLLLSYCRNKAGMSDPSVSGPDGGGDNVTQGVQAIEVVEAEWDSDEE